MREATKRVIDERRRVRQRQTWSETLIVKEKASPDSRPRVKGASRLLSSETRA